jgi:hypothetical protein
MHSIEDKGMYERMTTTLAVTIGICLMFMEKVIDDNFLIVFDNIYIVMSTIYFKVTNVK